MRGALVIACVCLSLCLYAQQPINATLDSIVRGQGTKMDSVYNARKDYIDNLRSNKVLGTSLPTSTLDSIKYNFYQKSDSLKQSFHQRFSSLDSGNNDLQHKVDSLTSLNLPTEKYTHKIDSIAGKQQEAAAALNGKLEDLKKKSLGKIDGLELSPELQTQANALTKDIQGFRLPVKDFNIPALNTPGNPLSGLDGLNTSVQSPIGQIGNIKGMPQMPGELGKLSGIGQQAGKYGGDLKNISQGNLKEVQQLPKGLEDKAGQMAGIGDMKKQTDGLLGQGMPAQDPAAMKKQLVQEGQKQAVNHFAGKEDVLRQAMDKMSKLKTKYESLNSLSEATKKRPNAMRGKPFRERLVPGISLQIQKKADNIYVDFNPYAGYRFSGRITAGLGWNQRVGYDTDYDRFTSAARIFGPRAIGEFRLNKGFVPRAECEYMNTWVPPHNRQPVADVRQRDWVPGAFVGMKKEYKFMKGVKGHVMIMLRVFNYQHKSPYNDVLNMRVGFEFPRKAHKSQKK